MGEPQYRYEPIESFGSGLTTSRPWNILALEGVERLTGLGPAGQVWAMLRWTLS